MYRFDVTFQVVWVHEAFLAMRADKLVRPQWVMDEDMMTGDVSLRSSLQVQLRHLLQTMLANAISSAVLAYEFQINHLAVIGDGNKGLGVAKEVLLSTLHIAGDVRSSCVREQIGGMRSVFLSPGKARVKSWTCFCDNMLIFAWGAQRRTRPNRRAKPRVISSMID
jgi:hypothetical protein